MSRYFGKNNRRVHQLLVIFFFILAVLLIVSPVAAGITRSEDPSIYLPVLQNDASPVGSVCGDQPGYTYGALSVLPPPTDRPAAEHADLNLALRSYRPVDAYRGLISLGGDTDAKAPQLRTMFADSRIPTVTATYAVYDWDWQCNCRAQPLASPPVTMMYVGTSPNEVILAPDSGYGIGSGYEALVLYADRQRLTLKYTRNDNVVSGYTIHFEGLCVNPSLLTRYRDLDVAGRGQLPALVAGQTIGQSAGATMAVAIRDTGRFMDPRSQKDWWR